MNVTLLFLFLCLSGIGSKLFSKFCSNLIVGSTTACYALFYTLNSLVACGFFWVTSGFDLTLNLPTLLYSFLHALVVLTALFFSLLAYRLFDVASLSVLSSALTPVTTSLVGALPVAHRGIAASVRASLRGRTPQAEEPDFPGGKYRLLQCRLAGHHLAPVAAGCVGLYADLLRPRNPYGSYRFPAFA